MATSLTRRIVFSATHHYRVAEWSDEHNENVFGALQRAHAHAYACDVTVTGQPDRTTGFVIDLGALDLVLDREVRERFHNRDINADVPEFGAGALLPSCENLARFICERIQIALGNGARVIRVSIAEDASLSATHEP